MALKLITQMGYSYWKAKAIKMAEDIAKLRDKLHGGLCRICGKRPIQVAYHVIPRSKIPTAWMIENIVGACRACNFGELMHRLDYREKHIKIFGEAYYEHLVAVSKNGKKKFSKDEMRNIYEKLLIVWQTRNFGDSVIVAEARNK